MDNKRCNIMTQSVVSAYEGQLLQQLINQPFDSIILCVFIIVVFTCNKILSQIRFSIQNNRPG